jgi:hypothetical protein
MALKPPGPLAPGVSHAKPVLTTSRPSTGAPLSTVVEMSVELDFAIGLEVSAVEADLYLHWASDLLAPATDDDDDGNS